MVRRDKTERVRDVAEIIDGDICNALSWLDIITDADVGRDRTEGITSAREW